MHSWNNRLYGISICAIYTQMEAKVMLVHLLKTFTLSLPDDYQLKVTQYIELIQPDGAIPCSAVLGVDIIIE